MASQCSQLFAAVVHTFLCDACIYQGTVQDAPLFVVCLKHLYLGSIIPQVANSCKEAVSILAALSLQRLETSCRYVHCLHECANQCICIVSALE